MVHRVQAIDVDSEAHEIDPEAILARSNHQNEPYSFPHVLLENILIPAVWSL